MTAPSKVFTAGFVGASTNEATRWVAEQVKGARRIVVPFTGSGKDIAAMVQAAPGVHVDSWDVQRLSALNVRGIFAQPKPERRVLRPTLFIGNMPAPTNGKWPADAIALWHGINRRGTDYERAALVRATVRCSFQGKLTGWKRGATAETLWEEYLKGLATFEPWTGLPGTFDHREGSFYDYHDAATGSWDVVQVDPPKVTTKADIYSGNTGFAKLNAALGGGEIMPWHEEHVLERLVQTFELDARRIVFLYATGLHPGEDVLEDVLYDYGTLVERRIFHHRGRTDIGYVVDKP